MGSETVYVEKDLIVNMRGKETEDGGHRVKQQKF